MAISSGAAAALAASEHLHDFEGRDVARTTVQVTNAGDGLSESLGIAPGEIHIGDRVFVLLECVATRVAHGLFDKQDPQGPLERKHTLRAGTATIVGEDVARPLIDAQRKLNDDARGVQALPLDEGDSEAEGQAELDDLKAKRRARRSGEG